MEDKILASVVRLEQKVDRLTEKVAEHESKLRWITAAALLVLGVVGGPNAVQFITTGGTSG